MNSEKESATQGIEAETAGSSDQCLDHNTIAALARSSIKMKLCGLIGNCYRLSWVSVPSLVS